MSEEFFPGVEVFTPGMGASGGRGETRVGQEEGNWSYQFLVIQLASNLW